MNLPLEYRPLLGLSTIAVGPLAVLLEQCLLSRIVQERLLFSVVVPLLSTGLTKQNVRDAVASLIFTVFFQGTLHSNLLPSVSNTKLCAAIQARENHNGL